MPNPKKSDRKPRHNYGDRKPVTTDERFSHIHSDPRFAPAKRKDTRVQLDDRFSGLLTDKRFSSKATVDRYGRKQDRSAERKDLERLYELDKKKDEDEASESEGEGEDEGEPRFDPARGEGIIDTSEESESESDIEDDEEEELVDVDVEREGAAVNVPTGEVSRRLAVVNLDWENVRAMDLMKALASFAPSGGRVKKVTVYPSEFGRERMDREEMEGPPREIFAADEDDIDCEEEVDEKTVVKEDKGEEFDSAKLRAYQLERLRYYYAVVECDNVSTAKHIYENCDGAEYEATANFFDLRFIPDNTSFDDDTPRDACDRDPDAYVPNDFVTDALQHSKVKLTWDEEDTQRKQVSKRAFSQRDIEENELKAYLASSDSELEGEDKEASKEKYRALLGGLFLGKKGSESSGDMEVTFTSGLGERDTAKVIDEDEGLTTIEKYAKKEKERRMKRKEKARLAREEAAAATGITLPKNPGRKESEPTQEAADLGFDDPFFDEPVQANNKIKKEEKKKRHGEKERASAENAAKKAELELIMADDDEILGENGKKLSHFDMKAVIKSQKAQKLKKGAKRKQEKKIDTDAVQDNFEIDVKDPRFSAIFERHEYAIDPTNPRFVKTKDMTKLMEERRKRSGKDRGDGGPEGEGRDKKRKKVDKKKDDVKSLVESLKKKSKR